MGSAGRPHRRARSAKVLYKDSASEDEADENSSAADQPIPSDRVRKNLALKRVSRSQERVEAFQIQKAIQESLSSTKVNATDDTKEVVDSEEEAPDVPGSITIEAGPQYPCAGSPQEASESMFQDRPLEKQPVFNETPKSSVEIVHEDGGSSRNGLEGALNPKDIKSTGIANADKTILEAVVLKKNEDSSCEEEEDDDDDEEEEVTDAESSDASEDLKYKRKRPVNSQQKGRKAAGNTAKDPKVFTAQVKKRRSSRLRSEAKAPIAAKKGLPSNDNSLKPSAQCKAADAKEKDLTSTAFETSKKHAKETNGNGRRRVLLKGCKQQQNSPSATKLNKASLLDHTSCESSGILGVLAHSPTGLHRRVIGLSRRFKPPPLHPYLPKIEG